jgi:hypothetical protein
MRKELLIWAEVIRQHYMGLEGAGAEAIPEATFFLEWHYEMRGSL